jgi:hypothetical protein
MYLGVHVKYPSFFSDFIEKLILLRDFREILRY